MTEPSCPPQPAPAQERRLAVRHCCRDGASVPTLFRAASTPDEARLRDLSTSGMGLLLDRPVEVGAPLAVRFPGLLPGATLSRPASVVHVTPCEPGRWLVGCKLAHPLSDDQIKQILSQ